MISRYTQVDLYVPISVRSTGCVGGTPMCEGQQFLGSRSIRLGWTSGALPAKDMAPRLAFHFAPDSDRGPGSLVIHWSDFYRQSLLMISRFSVDVIGLRTFSKISQVALLDHRSGARLGSCGWPHQLLEFQWEPAFNIRLILCLAMSCSLFDAAFSKYGKNGKMMPFLCAVPCCTIMPKLVDQIPWFHRVPPSTDQESAKSPSSCGGGRTCHHFRKRQRMTASWHSGDFCQRSWRTWVMLLLDAFSMYQQYPRVTQGCFLLFFDTGFKQRHFCHDCVMCALFEVSRLFRIAWHVAYTSLTWFHFTMQNPIIQHHSTSN